MQETFLCFKKKTVVSCENNMKKLEKIKNVCYNKK